MAGRADSAFLTAAEAAVDPELFDGSVTSRWLIVEARAGRISLYKFGKKSVKFRREELRAYIERSRRAVRAS